MLKSGAPQNSRTSGETVIGLSLSRELVQITQHNTNKCLLNPRHCSVSFNWTCPDVMMHIPRSSATNKLCLEIKCFEPPGHSQFCQVHSLADLANNELSEQGGLCNTTLRQHISVHMEWSSTVSVYAKFRRQGAKRLCHLRSVWFFFSLFETSCYSEWE